jgi:hypothetical protein
MPTKLHRAIKVSSVTITTVSVTCERCKRTTSGECSYPNHEMFVARELKHITIKLNRSTRSMYPVTKLVCMDCAKDLEAAFEKPAEAEKWVHQEGCTNQARGPEDYLVACTCFMFAG